jgi:hypothetical protein
LLVPDKEIVVGGFSLGRIGVPPLNKIGKFFCKVAHHMVGDTKEAIGQAVDAVSSFQFFGTVGENGGATMAVDKFVNEVQEIGITLATPIKSRQTTQDFTTRGNRGEGLSSQTEKFARIDVKAVVTRLALNGEIDKVAFFAVSSHSCMFLSFFGTFIISLLMYFVKWFFKFL